MLYSEMPLPLSPNNEIHSASYKCCKYVRRLFKFEQMDFQFALWQMLYLFVAPHKLTNLFRARKYSKSQYARDDPAFLVLFAASMCITSVVFALILNFSFGQCLSFLIFMVFVDCIGLGLLIATLLWTFSNFVLKPYSSSNDVEWGFAFDVHLNAIFPPLILLHFVLLIFYNGLIDHNIFLSVLFGNTFWLLSALYYIYITFVGYNSLQILNRTQILLLPIPLVFLFYIVCLVSNINIPYVLLWLYKYRIGYY